MQMNSSHEDLHKVMKLMFLLVCFAISNLLCVHLDSLQGNAFELHIGLVIKIKDCACVIVLV